MVHEKLFKTMRIAKLKISLQSVFLCINETIYLFSSIVIYYKKVLAVFACCFENCPIHGVQRRIISVDNFFRILEIIISALLLLYVT